MGASSFLLWKFMITEEMNGQNADLFLGADQGMPQLPPSIPACSTQTPDNTGHAVVGSSIGVSHVFKLGNSSHRFVPKIVYHEAYTRL